MKRAKEAETEWDGENNALCLFLAISASSYFNFEKKQKKIHDIVKDSWKLNVATLETAAVLLLGRDSIVAAVCCTFLLYFLQLVSVASESVCGVLRMCV